ncbi:HEPN domain-containing protein [Sphingobacterium sp. UT-1RO-CII-1]|uniref:HEPN domain-containing protein n=1 Tax=Sphingobacterium sp. UT-1RO-CII-1 TaxID=2995225 RepID=UPI00227D5115|nr:HEPN domain-containing protein [Sphingobacterium sp. UT-1RO-CII-1]MCY4781164.1 HEPN domain-containing protein [Sphingobacterium sp. UT-1RO-CII-1]
MTAILESNFEIIFKHLTVDEIFLWTYNRNGIVQTIVQVHTHNKQRSSTLRERCARALLPMEGYFFTFYNTKEVQSRINDGLGRLYLNCQPKNRIYVNPNPINTVILPEISSDELLEQTREYIKREKDKITAFMDGYYLYYSKENYPNAAFMLHQTLEISLRVAQKLLLGVEDRSHSLKQNINFFRPYDSVLSNLISTKEEEQAINRLTEAYTGSRYKNNFIMDLQKIEFCKDIADRILQWITDYKQDLLQEIEEKFSSIEESHQQTEIIKTKIDMEKSTNINNNHRDLIHNALETYGQIHGLYCFAYVTHQDSMCNLLNVLQSHNEVHHYYLFAIMSNQNRPIMDLQNCVMQLLPEKIKVTLIQESPEQVEKKLKKGDVFRTNLLQAGECWYRDREYIKDVRDLEIETIDWLKLENKWKNYQKKAHDLKYLPNEFAYEVEYETTIFLLALSLEQICLGLLNTHLRYAPHSTNLNYMMDLCQAFYPNLCSVFVRHNKHNQIHFSALVKAQGQYKYSDYLFGGVTEIEILNKNITQFSKDTDYFMTDYFQQQKELQDANKTENIEQCA